MVCWDCPRSRQQKGKDIPRPTQPQTIQAKLTQNNEPAQTVKVFNYKQPGVDYGVVSFAVPSLEAAISGMEDVQKFDLAIENKSVLNVEWHSGLSARDQLRRCVNDRPKNR